MTFYRLPANTTQKGIAKHEPRLLDVRVLKSQFYVDAYMVDLGADAATLVGRAAYWYSMWSHRRDNIWKGFVELDLANTHDAAVQSVLASRGTS